MPAAAHRSLDTLPRPRIQVLPRPSPGSEQCGEVVVQVIHRSALDGVLLESAFIRAEAEAEADVAVGLPASELAQRAWGFTYREQGRTKA